MTSSTDGGTGIGRLQILIGAGCGKSYVIDSVITTLKGHHEFSDSQVLVCATAGK